MNKQEDSLAPASPKITIFGVGKKRSADMNRIYEAFRDQAHMVMLCEDENHFRDTIVPFQVFAKGLIPYTRDLREGVGYTSQHLELLDALIGSSEVQIYILDLDQSNCFNYASYWSQQARAEGNLTIAIAASSKKMELPTKEDLDWDFGTLLLTAPLHHEEINSEEINFAIVSAIIDVCSSSLPICTDVADLRTVLGNVGVGLVALTRGKLNSSPEAIADEAFKKLSRINPSAIDSDSALFFIRSPQVSIKETSEIIENMMKHCNKELNAVFAMKDRICTFDGIELLTILANTQKKGYSDGVIVVDLGLESWTSQMNALDAWIIETPPKMRYQDKLESLLPHRIFVTADDRDFTENAKKHEIGVIQMDEALLETPNKAIELIDELIRSNKLWDLDYGFYYRMRASGEVERKL